MSQLFHSYRTYGDDRIGRIYDVLITERASDDVHLVGHNKSYEQILVPDRAQLLGCMARVRIVSCSKFSMLAELIDTSRTRPNVDPRVTTGYCWPSSTNAIVVVFVVVVIVYWLLRHLH
jgi:threonylcarbamoyladenosine tRNA methylthiotransferase CDKAL1